MQNRTIKAARLPFEYKLEGIAFIIGFVATKLFGLSAIWIIAFGICLLCWMLLRTIIQENTFAEFLDDGIRIFVTKPWFDERTIPYSQILFIHFTQSDVQREFGLATLKLRSAEGEARIKNIREHREVKAFLVEKLSKIVDVVSSS